MFCPDCGPKGYVIKKGFFKRAAASERIQKYLCKTCHRCFSAQTGAVDYRLRLRAITQNVFTLLASGISQKRLAFVHQTRPRTIARRVVRFGECCKENLAIYRKNREKVQIVLFDEMESFEHTNAKPLTLPIAVEQKTRKILALRVGPIAAKGMLAKASVEKYGKRKCERKRLLDEMLLDLKECTIKNVRIKTDMSRHYPSPIAKHFPHSNHEAFKGRKPQENGLGELKVGAFDPLFSLNHTYGMIRCNIKRLSRRTWATTKKVAQLEHLLYIYAWFHNMWLDRDKSPVLLSRICG
jgi:transposase-like protein